MNLGRCFPPHIADEPIFGRPVVDPDRLGRPWKEVGDRRAPELQRVRVEHEPRWGDMPEQEQQVEPPIGAMASEIVEIEEMELGRKLKVLLQQPVPGVRV